MAKCHRPCSTRTLLVKKALGNKGAWWPIACNKQAQEWLPELPKPWQGKRDWGWEPVGYSEVDSLLQDQSLSCLGSCEDTWSDFKFEGIRERVEDYCQHVQILGNEPRSFWVDLAIQASKSMFYNSTSLPFLHAHNNSKAFPPFLTQGILLLQST